MIPNDSFLLRSRKSQIHRFHLAAAAALGLALLAGCGGGGSGTTTVLQGSTNVVLLASSTANDQLVQFPLTLSSLTLTTRGGRTATVFSSPLSAEYIHLNGNVEPLVSVSIPQAVYTSATATYGGTAPVCVGAPSSSSGLLIDGALNGPGKPTVTVNLPEPITVTGKAMGLVLNLQVSASAPFTGACAENLSVPVSPVFNLTPLTIAAQPTSSANGMAYGLQGTVTSVDADGSSFTVTAPVGYWNGNAPVWQVSAGSSTSFQGIGSAAGLVAGMPVDMDLALQPDGSLLATRVAVYDTDATNLSLGIGQAISPGYVSSSINALTSQVVGELSSLSDVYIYASASSQISTQFTNLQSLPFPATFTAATTLPGQNLLIASNAPPVGGYPPLPLPIATMALMPQTINGTVSAISTSGSFTVYTVTLAPYDVLAELANQSGEPTEASPGTVVVYADSSTQMLNSSAVAVGSVVRFYGLLFNDSGTLRMDCAQVNDGVTE